MTGGEASQAAGARASNPFWSPVPPPDRPRPAGAAAPFSLVDLLARFRWIVIVPVVLPLSFLWAALHSLRTALAARRRGPANEAIHSERVAEVQARVRSRDPTVDGRICTARQNFWSVSTRDGEYKKAGAAFPVDLSALQDVVDVDVTRMVVKVEPYVDMGRLTAALLPKGVCTPVVPEYDDLTVGGLINGYGIEGSSHKYGLFSDIVESVDVVVADGTLVHATRTNEASDLFFALPWSYGALGLLVAAEIRIIPVAPYMRVTYYPVRGTLKELGVAWERLMAPADRPWNEYVEGLIYDSSHGVITVADYATEAEAMAEGPINRMGWWFKPWFHRYAETILNESVDGASHVEYVPTRDYYHRHTRSLYWEAELLVPFGNVVAFRWLAGWLMPPRVSFLKLTMVAKLWEYYNTKFVAHDVLVPLQHTAACMEFMHDTYDIYPLWLCPHRLYKTRRGTMLDAEPGYEHRVPLAPGDSPDAQMFTDVGVWYTPGPILRGQAFDTAAASHKMEQWLIDHHGYQAMYAISELDEKDFWRMFDKTLYAECRAKYGADGVFMDVYYKVGRKGSSASAQAKAIAGATDAKEDKKLA